MKETDEKEKDLETVLDALRGKVDPYRMSGLVLPWEIGIYDDSKDQHYFIEDADISGKFALVRSYRIMTEYGVGDEDLARRTRLDLVDLESKLVLPVIKEAYVHLKKFHLKVTEYKIICEYIHYEHDMPLAEQGKEHRTEISLEQIEKLKGTYKQLEDKTSELEEEKKTTSGMMKRTLVGD